MPKRRKNADYMASTRTRGRQASNEQEKDGYQINLESIRCQLLEIESIYTSTMGNMNREWDTLERREQVIDAIQNSEDVASLYRLMGTIEEAFCNPWQVVVKKDKVGELDE